MTIVTVVVAPWLRCNRHHTEFVDLDPVWAIGGHKECAFRPTDRTQTIVIIGEDLRLVRGWSEDKRMFCCEACDGRGLHISYALSDPTDGLVILARLGPPDQPDPEKSRRVLCCTCNGRGYH